MRPYRLGVFAVFVTATGCTASGGLEDSTPIAGSGGNRDAGSVSNLGGSASGGTTGVAIGDAATPTPTPTPTPEAAPAFECNGAGIAAFADRLVHETRKLCTSAGVGVVTDTNYSCMQAPLDGLAPFSSAGYA